MTMVAVYVRFVGARHFKWPLRAGDIVELYSPDHELVGELDAAMLLDLLATYLRMARTVHTLGERVSLDTLPVEQLRLGLVDPRPPPVLPAPLPKPPVKITAVQRAAHRAQRKRRDRRAS